MDFLLELLKYTIPGLTVFLTAYYLLKLQFDNQQAILVQQRLQESLKTTLPLRLQAYERLMLLCDRVSLPNLLLRIRMPGMNVGELRGALLLTLNQEFEHNTSQQVYVSDTLWQILLLARGETMAAITQAADGLDPQLPDEAMIQRLIRIVDAQENGSPLQKAMIAIRTEAGRLL
jgi:hypothetical protein